MKTSTMFCIAAASVLIMSLMIYDNVLKAALLNRNYTDEYACYKNLSFKNFDAFEIPASQIANIKFIQGPYGIKIAPGAIKHVQIQQNGTQLQIGVKKGSPIFLNNDSFLLIISCPRIISINISSMSVRDGQLIIDTTADESPKGHYSLIKGFKQDSITILQNYGSQVVLAGNHISFVKAVVGQSFRSASKITILEDNHFEYANLQILNRSKLVLRNAEITDLNYHLADSSQLVVNGAANNSLIKP
ncbi:hypothetical protein ACRQ5D_34480 [Mucilaginibacter sp. P25]|uniref:hypothetical protein n=1 Tax=Mucilaginibacter sp. P25 TaxID=3423945 RepID=UPI003D7B7A98